MCGDQIDCWIGLNDISVENEFRWDLSKTACVNKGATLAKIDDEAQQKGLEALLDPSMDCYIGLNDITTPDTWVWEGTGTTHTKGVDYGNWYSGNPAVHATQNCVLMKKDQSWEWDDLVCGKDIQYACRKEATSTCG